MPQLHTCTTDRATIQPADGILLSLAPDHEHCSLPIRLTPESTSRWRWDAYDAMTKYNIFRNSYEIPQHSQGRPRCVISERSWPDYTEA